MATTLVFPDIAGALGDRDLEMIDALETMADPHAILLMKWLGDGPMGEAEIARRSGWGAIVLGCAVTDLIDAGLVAAANSKFSLDTERLADVAAYVSGLGHRTITLGSRER